MVELDARCAKKASTREEAAVAGRDARAQSLLPAETEVTNSF